MVADKEKELSAKDKGKGKDAAEEKEDKAEGKEGEDAGAEAGGDELEGKKKLGKKKLIIIGAVGAFILLLGGGAAGYFLMQGKGSGEEKQEQAAEAEKTEESGKPVYLELGDLTVNLAGEGKRPNYLKLKVSLELADEKDVPAIQAIKPRIIDNFQVYLRELRIDDLRGSAGIYRLREELLLRVTEAAQPVRIKDVLFQEMLVQ